MVMKFWIENIKEKIIKPDDTEDEYKNSKTAGKWFS